VTYFRKISPAEATYLAKDKIPNGQFVNQFFIEGTFANSSSNNSTGNKSTEMFDQTQWQNAVEKAAIANPGICLQLKGYWGFRYWKKVNVAPKVINYKGDWDGLSSQGFEAIAPFINPRKDSNVSVILINKLNNTEGNHTAIILFRIHHGLCDGAATAHWIQEIFRALRREPLLGSISTVNELDIVNRTDYPLPSVFRGRCLPLFPKSTQPELRACHWIKSHWDHNEQRIVAKILFVLREIAIEQHGEGRTVFRLTSDLRHYLTRDELTAPQMSNLSGIFDIEVKKDESIKRIQFNIIKALRNKNDLSVYPKKLLRFTPWLPGSLFNLKPKGARNMHERGVCNLTAMIGYANHIDLDAVSFKGFKAHGAFAIPMATEDKSIFMGISSSPNGIDVILSAPNALSNIECSTALANKVNEKLNKL
jgi:hypothetical protein